MAPARPAPAMSARSEGSPARALARLYCPPGERAVFGALAGIETEIRSGIERPLEHEVAHARLSWWREECARLASGQPQHPLTRALSAQFAPEERGVLSGVQGFTDLAAWDLAGAKFASRGELQGYAARWSSAFVAPLAQRALAPAARAAALALGGALAELELLNALPAHARAGQLRLPLDELAASAVAPEELTAARFGEELTTLLRHSHRRARAKLAAAVAALHGPAQPALRGLMVWSALSYLHSQRSSTALPRASLPREHHGPLDGIRAWRAARRAGAGNLRLAPD
jgi:phytoene synthase